MLNEALRELIEEDRPYNVEFRIRRPDTADIVDIYSVAEYDRDRNVVFGIIQDVTDRKRAEADLGKIAAFFGPDRTQRHAHLCQGYGRALRDDQPQVGGGDRP